MCVPKREGERLPSEGAKEVRALAFVPSESKQPAVPVPSESMSDIMSDSILVWREPV